METKTLKELVAIDSPTGYTAKAAEYVMTLLRSYGWKPELTNKGAVRCVLSDSENPTLAVAGHIDTLGAIVSSIRGDGTLGFHKVGGPSLHAYEGSYCRIRTLKDNVYNGTLLLNNPSMHVNKNLGSAKRDIDNMHIRVDEVVSNADDIQKLGISVGDFICFETHYQEFESGFIKSKFMDNKAGCFVLFEIARLLAEQKKTAPVELFFSNYEEVGHGAATGFSDSIEEMLTIDMAVVGNNRTGNETKCSICALDSSGPYDYDFRKRLVEICEKKKIDFVQDVYPFYGSDGSAALAAGANFRVALIGPGVSASHGIERTHKKGIKATVDLCMAYIETL